LYCNFHGVKMWNKSLQLYFCQVLCRWYHIAALAHHLASHFIHSSHFLTITLTTPPALLQLEVLPLQELARRLEGVRTCLPWTVSDMWFEFWILDGTGVCHRVIAVLGTTVSQSALQPSSNSPSEKTELCGKSTSRITCSSSIKSHGRRLLAGSDQSINALIVVRT